MRLSLVQLGAHLGPTLTLMGSNVPEFQARGSYSIEEGCQLARGTQGWMGGDAGTLVSIAPEHSSVPNPASVGISALGPWHRHTQGTPRAHSVSISGFVLREQINQSRDNSAGLEE